MKKVEERLTTYYSSLLSNRIWGLYYFPGLSLSQATEYFRRNIFNISHANLFAHSISPCETRQRMVKDSRMAKAELGRFDSFSRGVHSLHSWLTTWKILPSGLARKLWIHATAESLLVIATATDCFNTHLRSCTGGKRPREEAKQDS